MIDELISWKTIDKRKPILLTGAKGVGKTYLAYDFAKAFFERILYINFEREHGVSEFFESKDPAIINQILNKHFHLNEEATCENKILILDEVSFSSSVLSSLKPLQQTGYYPYILIITSNPLPSEYKNEFNHIPVHPMDFDEFLKATANEWYIEAIITHYEANKKIPDIVHKELLALHELYMQIGGMPGIINEYLNLSSTVNIAEQHSFLMNSYHDYIIKSSLEGDALKMNQVLDSLSYQLRKENKKFQYKLIRKGTTHAMYKDAIQSLIDRNYVIPCLKLSNEQIMQPITYLQTKEINKIEYNNNFKLYMSDIGLLYTEIAKEEFRPFNKISQKSLLENYVAQALMAKGYQLMFWESDSMAKVDFIIIKNNEIVPIEIHRGNNTRSKSISVLKQKCEFPYAIKISEKNFEYSNSIKYVPHYAVFCI